MNGKRYERSATPEGRIASVIRGFLLEFERRNEGQGRPWEIVDYADFEKVLRPYIRKELLQARLDELDHGGHAKRKSQLSSELAVVNAEIEISLRKGASGVWEKP